MGGVHGAAATGHPDAAPDQDAALAILEELESAWADDKTRVLALDVWRRAWTQVVPFLAFPDEIRRITYTTNTVESLHAQIRKTIKNNPSRFAGGM